ncbi:hypothetical protein GCM10010245_79940 [Streptomyces spectabilis]|nr:hypothetical protein GCM10010245_79940 [Streptomyces spectabilis]
MMVCNGLCVLLGRAGGGSHGETSATQGPGAGGKAGALYAYGAQTHTAPRTPRPLEPAAARHAGPGTPDIRPSYQHARWRRGPAEGAQDRPGHRPYPHPPALEGI